MQVLEGSWQDPPQSFPCAAHEVTHPTDPPYAQLFPLFSNIFNSSKLRLPIDGPLLHREHLHMFFSQWPVAQFLYWHEVTQARAPY
jgi:hypothetical protein